MDPHFPTRRQVIQRNPKIARSPIEIPPTEQIFLLWILFIWLSDMFYRDEWVYVEKSIKFKCLTGEVHILIITLFVAPFIK